MICFSVAGEWSEWTACSKTCDEGVRMRNRTCESCNVTIQTQSCKRIPCQGESENVGTFGPSFESLVRSFVRSFARLFIYFCVRSFVSLFSSSFDWSFVANFEDDSNHRWPKLDIWVALCGPLHCYVTRAICIFIKICMGKEINPKKKNEKLPLNYNKNRLPEFQLRFLCVLCDFLTDLERFSVV